MILDQLEEHIDRLSCLSGKCWFARHHKTGASTYSRVNTRNNMSTPEHQARLLIFDLLQTITLSNLLKILNLTASRPADGGLQPGCTDSLTGPNPGRPFPARESCTCLRAELHDSVKCLGISTPRMEKTGRSLLPMKNGT